MNARIPVRYDMMLRPEWIDYALEQYVLQPDEASHRKVLHDYLEAQIHGKEATIKTVSQLLRNVGARSPIPREKLEAYYVEMSQLAPDQRAPIRLCILEASSPFFADCVSALRKLDALGIEHVGVKQLYERMTAKYGDRETIYRRVRYVLSTLSRLGVVANSDRTWQLIKKSRSDVL